MFLQKATILNKLVQRDKAKEEVKIISLFVGGQNMFLRIYLIFGLPILLLAAFSEARSPPWDSAGRNPDDSGKKPSGSEREKDSGTSPTNSGESRREYTVCSIEVNTTPSFYKNSGVLLKFSLDSALIKTGVLFTRQKFEKFK